VLSNRKTVPAGHLNTSRRDQTRRDNPFLHVRDSRQYGEALMRLILETLINLVPARMIPFPCGFGRCAARKQASAGRNVFVA
jgi:hypothetical protein